MIGWPSKLKTKTEEWRLLKFGAWKEVMAYFFPVMHRDKLGTTSPMHLTALQELVATELDKAAGLELERIIQVHREGGDVYITDFPKRYRPDLSAAAHLDRGIISRYEVGLKLLVLKSRRGGASTFFLCAAIRGCLTIENYSAITFAEIIDSTRKIFKIGRFALDRWRTGIWLVAKALGIPGKPAAMLHEFDNGSSHEAVTAGSTTRGGKYDFIHLSEYAHYGNNSDVKQLANAAMQHVWLIKESTANGTDNAFYQDWQDGLTPDEVQAARRKGDFKKLGDWNGHYKIFFPWWADPGLKSPVTHQEEEHVLDTLDDHEIELQELTEGEISVGHIKWRRDKIKALSKDDLDGLTPKQFFNQEFPWSPMSAFQATSKSVYTPDLTEHQRGANKPERTVYLMFGRDQPPRKVERGPIAVYAPPVPNQAYCMAADIGQGVGESYSEASIFSREDGTILDEVANIRTNRLGPSVFAWVCHVLAYAYNDAYIIPEANGGGVAFINTLIHNLGYNHIAVRTSDTLDKAFKRNPGVPRYGVWWSEANKPVAVEGLRMELETAKFNNSFRIRSQHILNQIDIYQSDGRRYKAPRGQLDDGVEMLMALIMGKPSMPPVEAMVNPVKKSAGYQEDTVFAARSPYDEMWDTLLKKVDRVGAQNQRLGTLGMVVPMERR